jgi:hypothetical protein
MAQTSLFVINPKIVPTKSETHNFVENSQFSLYFRNTAFNLDLYIFDEHETPIRRQVEFLFSEKNIDTLFKRTVFPLLKLDPTNSPKIEISDSVFAEILYQDLWPITEKKLHDHFEEYEVILKIKNA